MGGNRVVHVSKDAYFLHGEYPNGRKFSCLAAVDSYTDALILAQGAKMVTTLCYCEVIDSDGTPLARF